MRDVGGVAGGAAGGAARHVDWLARAAALARQPGPRGRPSAIAAEVLNAIPVVQSCTAEQREASRFATAAESAFSTAAAHPRTLRAGGFHHHRQRRPAAGGLYRGTQAVLAGEMTAGHLGQTVVYVMLLAGAVAVLGEVYGDLLRAAGATERLMELLASESPVAEPAAPCHCRPRARAGGRVCFGAVSLPIAA